MKGSVSLKTLGIGIGLLLLFCLFICLGFWQLQRYSDKTKINQALHDKIQNDSNPLPYHTFNLQGEFDNQKVIYWDNKINQGRAGYDIILPFKSHQQVYLVDIGWLPRTESIEHLPIIKPIENKVKISGLVYYPKNNIFVHETNTSADWPQVVQKIDLSKLSKDISKPIKPYIILLQTPKELGYVKDWPILQLNPMMHLSYALQWFSLAALTLIFSLIGIYKIRNRHEICLQK